MLLPPATIELEVRWQSLQESVSTFPQTKINILIESLSSFLLPLVLAYPSLWYRSHEWSRSEPGWAWIFILEGLFTFLFGLVSYALLPRSPVHAHFLSQQEKEYAVARLTQRASKKQQTASAGEKSARPSYSHKSSLIALFFSPQLPTSLRW
jgi:hypothetical protein